jgi:hypothetical protein
MIKNKALFPILIGTLVCVIIMVYIPAVADLFHFVAMDIKYFLLAIGIGFCSILRFEVVKRIARKRNIELLKN